jgi:hypothetical protein
MNVPVFSTTAEVPTKFSIYLISKFLTHNARFANYRAVLEYSNSNWLLRFLPKTNRKYLPVPNLAQNRAKSAILDTYKVGGY